MRGEKLFIKLFAAVIVIFCNGSFSTAQQVEISGNVYYDAFPADAVKLPISGAEVKIWASRLQLVDQQSNQDDQCILLDSAITNENGLYALTISPLIEEIIYGTYRVSVTHSNYISRVFSLETYHDTVADIMLVSKTANASIEGFVGTGCAYSDKLCRLQPVKGCTVEVKASFPSVDDLRLPEGIVIYTGLVRLRTVTDELGLYTFDSIPLSVNGDRVSVRAWKNGYSALLTGTSVYNALTEEIDFNLVQGFGNYHNDTVLVTPLEPTDLDSLTFSLFAITHCCCADFWNKSVIVEDTIISLSYTVSDTICSHCMCESFGAWVQFKKGPLSAGHYAVYYKEIKYCPGETYPVESVSRRVGEITIDAGSPIKQTEIGKNLSESASLKGFGSNLVISLQQSSSVTLRIYNIQGALLSEIQMGHLPAGNHKVELKKSGNIRASEMIIVKMNVDGVSGPSRGVRLFYKE